MSGMFLRHPSIGFAILVNSSHPRGRKRFSYAHEYAHALLDRDRNIAVSTTDNSSELIERRANAFSAAFSHADSGRVRRVYEASTRDFPAARNKRSSMSPAVVTSTLNSAPLPGHNGSTTRTARCSLTTSARAIKPPSTD